MNGQAAVHGSLSPICNSGGDDGFPCQRIFEQFGTHHVLFLQRILIGKFNGLLELLQAAVLADGANGSLAAVPVLRSAIDAVIIVELLPSMVMRQRAAVVPSAFTLLRLMYGNMENVLRIMKF